MTFDEYRDEFYRAVERRDSWAAAMALSAMMAANREAEDELVAAETERMVRRAENIARMAAEGWGRWVE